MRINKMRKSKKYIFLILILSLSNIISNDTFAAEISKQDIKYYHQQVALQRYPWNMSGFIKSCMRGNFQIVEYYLKGGFNPNEPYMDSTPLMMAIYSKNIATAEVLLKNGADPNLERATLTPLHLAIRRNNLDMVKLLIKYNVDVNQECKKTKPINFAIKKNNYDIVDSLVKAGAQIDDKTRQKAHKSKDARIKEML